MTIGTELRTAICSTPACSRRPHAERHGYCLTCWQEHQHDHESPKDISDWQAFKVGSVTRWIKPKRAAA